MAIIFYPSCKIQADFPAESAAVRRYLETHYGVETAGCCRPHHPKLTPEDHAIVLCNNCANIVEESSKAGAFTYVWELIDRDADFPHVHTHDGGGAARLLPAARTEAADGEGRLLVQILP